jgi:predicted TIM-barrel fold metal-dependent hydrolase
MKIIDAHSHFNGDHPTAAAALEALDLRMLNICVAHEPGWRESRAQPYMTLAHTYHRQYAWCTAFDPPRFDDPQYIDSVIQALDRDFADGAVACKVWKDIGMTLRKPSGEFVLLDDPVLRPVFKHMERRQMPLCAHIAEPLACWQPLDGNNVYRAYYTNHPEYHMYNKPEYPSHEALMRARDSVAREHPRLTVVGAHLASLAHDVREVAQRLDAFPNLAVDLSGPARWVDLALQDRNTVRQFFTNYGDRIMYGTDCGCKSFSALSTEDRGKTLQELKQTTETALKFFGSDETLMLRGRTVRGLGLPEKVLAKIFFGNALRWYPALPWKV